MDKSYKKYQDLKARIHKVRIQKKRIDLLTGILIFVIVCAITILSAKFLESLFRLGTTGRLIVDLIGLVIIIATGAVKVFKPLWNFLLKNHPSDVQIAMEIGLKQKRIDDNFANALQIYSNLNVSTQGYSKPLIEKTVTEIYRQVKHIDFKKFIPTTPIKKYGRVFILTFILYFGLTVLFGETLRDAQHRLLNPFTEFKDKPKISIVVTPGDTKVLRNETVRISAVVEGKAVDKLDIHVREVNNEYHLKHALFSKSDNTFEYVIDHIQDTTAYYFSFGEVKTETYVIEIFERPLVQSLQVEIFPPGYTRLNPELLPQNIGDINCLKGSEAKVEIVSNKELAKASIVFGNERETKLASDGFVANGKFRVFREGLYKIHLKDQENYNNPNPIEYRISLVEDIYPNVYIAYPGKDVDLTEDLILSLSIVAEDDFGFSKLRLGYKMFKSDMPHSDTTQNYLPIDFDHKSKDKLVLEYLWDISSFDLFPGDAIQYFVEVFDNDVISGPKSSKSRTYSARFPTLEEIYAEVESDQEETYGNIEGLYEKSKELKETVDKLVQEMKQNPELKWEEKKQIEDILENQKQLEKTLEDVQQQLEQMVERMEKNNLLSLETLQKYNELQNLLNEVMTDELRKALKELQKSAENLDEELLKKVAEELKFTQDEFLKSIEKTLNILKRLQVEQKLDELVKKTEAIVKKQTEMSEQLEKDLMADQQKELAKKQEKIKEETSDLLSETNELKHSMEEFAEMPSDALEKILKKMAEEELIINMDQIKSKLNSGNCESAQQNSQNAQSSLSDMLDMLNQTKKSLIEQQKQVLMAELKRLSNNFLQVSKFQEDLLMQAKKLNPNSPLLTRQADKQHDLLNAVNRSADQLANLSNETFFVSADMLRSVGLSMQNMNKALANFEARNIGQTARFQHRAMLSLNEAVKQINSAMQQLSSSASAAGLQELMEKLSKMSGKQQGLNKETLQLSPGQQPMTLQQQAAMARLAAEQEALRKTMEELQREFGERSEILGDLDRIGQEMKEVVNDLENRNVTRKTINRQQRILQRLLDAQKSARTQDYSKKRRSETGKQYQMLSPAQLPENMGDKSDEIHRDLLKALKEGYSKDYQELIKAYFEALMKETINNEKIN